MENNQIDLENNYKMNLRVFENYAPQIYKRLMLKSNDAYCLELFENELNVSKNGNLIYPKGFVYEYFKHLLSEYYKRDSQNIFQYKLPIYSKDESIKYLTKKSIHAEYNVALYELYISIFNKKPILNSPNHNYIHTFTSFGIGLGYHIPELIKKYNIKNFVLLDVDIEMLRVSLFTIKWEEIFLYVTQKNKNRSMTILIEEGQETIDRQYGRYLSDYNSMGYYNLWQMTSYNDDILNQRVSSIIKNMDMYLSLIHI